MNEEIIIILTHTNTITYAWKNDQTGFIFHSFACPYSNIKTVTMYLENIVIEKRY